jgi:hypothetical protein
MNINVDAQLHNAFKAAAQGKEMTEILLAFIEQYVTQHTPAALPKKKGRS